MIGSDLETIVAGYCRPFGETYVTTAAAKYAVYTRALERMTEETLCLYDDRITFTLTVNTYAYTLTDTAVFSRKIALPLHVWIDGRRIDPEPNAQEIAFNPGYMAAAANKPRTWFLRPPATLVVLPKPDSAYSNCFVSGFWIHGLVDADADTIDVPDRDIETAAKACALALLEPWASGPGDLQATYQDLQARYQSEAAKIRARADGFFNREVVRKGRCTRWGL